MISNPFSRAPLHEHEDPVQRVLGVAALAPDSEVLLRLLAADPSREVRVAAARRCSVLEALAPAQERETEAGVRAAIAETLTELLVRAPVSQAAQAALASAACDDAIRSEVARRAQDSALRRAAIDRISDEAALVDLALLAGHAETRLAAAERVASVDGLRKLAEAAKNKDHGVARNARQRLDELTRRQAQNAEADAVIAQLEALAAEPGPILSAVIDLNRRWQALDMREEAERMARCDGARQAIQARFEREQSEQRARAQFERAYSAWLERITNAASDELHALREELAALHAEANALGGDAVLAQMQSAEELMVQRETAQQALAAAEALAHEAEQLAAGTSIDHGGLPARWQALAREVRTPALTQRFESAMTTVEQRRLTQIQATQQEASAARAQLHALLHTAEQALAAGQVQAARAAADATKVLKAAAGTLPKPTTQRLSRMVQQLVELERWESFGQQNARVQLCERAEAAPSLNLEPPQLALEVQKLRNEWKLLDQQHAGVPKSLWQRFDGACERAYAPAARYFSELGAKRKEARKQRDTFIAAAAEHAQALLSGPADWRANERWLRDTEHAWREGDLGSVDPGTWKKLDSRFKAALAPLRDALSGERELAKARRKALIEEVQALLANAMERDIPSQVKAIQAKWQTEAKSLALAQRDERALWNQFRSACDAVFEARQSKRKEEDTRRNDQRGELRQLCEQVEALAQPGQQDAQELRRALRELQEQWKSKSNAAEKRQFDARYSRAVESVESVLREQVRAKEAAVWRELVVKERMCEELDGALRAASGALVEPPSELLDKWAALPALPPAWEKKLAARRDAALAAFPDAGVAAKYLARMAQLESARRDALLEIEMQLGMESPSELQQQRLALQVKQLKERFRGANAQSASASERLLEWCAQPGVASESERQRCERIVARMETTR